MLLSKHSRIASEKIYSIARKNFSIDDIFTADVPVKALLIFVTNRGSYVVNELLIRSLGGKKVQVAVGGGVTELTDSLLGSILAFSGPNVEVASILIGSADREKEIRSKLKALKETGLHSHDCFAYMFSTIERGTCIHSKANLESSIFSEIFPNIPITGLFGYHVFGANFLPHLKLKTWNLDHGHFVKTRKNYRYGHCTVFVLIAVKKDNNCEIIKDKESV
ncbi:DNA-(apurinic or apyrimidinic site) lyase [Caerostris extrusa]|uniref:DNA-(Apurinic or apyrimidinic site) lyase n=1 Tax=Caerostris extrusa TaxID=172846 RepID=A0AAV4W292_CAEEX|nr:DNA-(apurinic or apyrimidinic site) lyase [Caerostris extrusa]